MDCTSHLNAVTENQVWISVCTDPNAMMKTTTTSRQFVKTTQVFMRVYIRHCRVDWHDRKLPEDLRALSALTR